LITFGSGFGKRGVVNAISGPAPMNSDFTALRLRAFALIPTTWIPLRKWKWFGIGTGRIRINRMKMKTLCLFCCLFIASVFAASEQDETTLIKAGDAAPEFRVTTVDGKTIDLKDAKGKVVLVNFFATWCGPCMQEMPHLQDEIWTRFKDKNFVLVSIDRGEKEEAVKAFLKKHTFQFPIACDTNKAVYSKFATKYIPRNYLINAKGIVVYQAAGFEEADFKKLVSTIEQETSKPN
jgi:peroxiredoxin